MNKRKMICLAVASATILPLVNVNVQMEGVPYVFESVSNFVYEGIAEAGLVFFAYKGLYKLSNLFKKIKPEA